MARESERLDLSTPLLVLSSGMLITPTHAARLEVDGAFAWLQALRRAGKIAVPLDARDALIDALLTASPRLAEAPTISASRRSKGSPDPT